MSEIRVPDLGENIDEAAVLRVLVHEGDRVEAEQPILELESDKASFELPCPEAGVVRKVLVHEGDTVKVGQPAIELEGGAAEAKPVDEQPGEAKPAAKPQAAEAKPTAKPQTAESKPTAEPQPAEAQPPAKQPAAEAKPTAKAHATEARQPAKPQAAESKPTARPQAAEAKPTAKPQAAEAKPTAEPQPAEAQPPAKQETAESEVAEEQTPVEAKQPAEQPAAEAKPTAKPQAAEAKPTAKPQAAEANQPERRQAAQGEPRAEPELGAGADIAVGPATRRFARELGVDLAEVARHADTKHITREHVLAYVRQGAGPARGDQRIALENVRRIAAQRLAAAWREVPHVTHHELADISELESARLALRAEDPELKLTITALAAKACTIALRSHPRLNSSLDLDHGELVLHHTHDLGIAVDTEQGLLVPVVRDVAHKTTRELAAEIADIAERARTRKLFPDELTGATFSITNLGGISGTSFTPIVVPPQVAILGLSRARANSPLEAGAPAARTWLPLSLSYDHRAVDGAEAARFMATLVRLLESPLRLVLDC